MHLYPIDYADDGDADDVNADRMEEWKLHLVHFELDRDDGGTIVASATAKNVDAGDAALEVEELPNYCRQLARHY